MHGETASYMKKGLFLLLTLCMLQHAAFSQKGKLDSLFAGRDTTAVMDSLLKDFDLFLDSAMAPKSFFNLSVGVGNGYFSFDNKNTNFFTMKNKLIFSPSVGYFHKSGLGMAATAFLINDDNGINAYQYAITPSYDLIRHNFSTGISYTRYFHKDSLNFYVTPIQNELFAYFTYKKWWLRPGINFSYGWGSRTEYEKRKESRKEQLKSLLKRLNRSNGNPDPVITEDKNELTVKDFSVTFSLRKDFNWYDVFGKNDMVTFTPVWMLNCGTMNFGFNYTTSNSVNAFKTLAVRPTTSPSSQYISNKTAFEPQSTSLVLRGSYLKGKLLIQPQIFFDYFLQEADDKFNTIYSITAGISF